MALILLRVLAAVGMLLIVAGVALVYPPAAFVVAGVECVATAYLIAEGVR